MVLNDANLRAGRQAAGLTHEASMPGFYQGARDCAVMGAALMLVLDST